MAKKYTETELEEIKKKLQKLPEVPKKSHYSKQESINFLKTEIESLQAKNYTIAQIADSLTGSGFDITTATLRNYIQRAKKQQKADTPPPPAAAQNSDNDKKGTFDVKKDKKNI